jgi:CBS domain containing-hemolysin-like protein
MGSSSSTDTIWIVIAAIAGVLYLLFDAARYFATQLSAVRLRRLSGDPGASGSSRWFLYDPHNFQLASGALLQICLVGAVGSTALYLAERDMLSAILVAIGIWIVVVVAWKFVLALVPESLAETLLRGLIPFSHVFYYLFLPVLFPLRKLFERKDRVEEANDDDEKITDEEVQAYIDVGEEEGILERGEGKLLQSIVDFGDRVARELMTPRIDVLSIEVNQPLGELARQFSESKYSRIPLYEGTIDTVVGIVHIKDVFDAVLHAEQKPLRELARPVYFVSETKKVSDLLREFQAGKQQAAIVVDEYGGTAGLITIEDVVEEIVGEISDEHEDQDFAPVQLDENSWFVNGLMRVAELEELVSADLQGEEYETVAGLIFTGLGRVPRVGESVMHNGVRFEVDRADRKRIYRVKVTRDPNWKPDEDEENT